MYKIYVNQSLLILCSNKDLNELNVGQDELCFMYTGNKKRLHNVIDLLEKSTKKQRTIIYNPEIKPLWRDFKSIFKFKIAAGGIVTNEQHELLVIFRRGFWDLPKGHTEKDESLKQTAIREVEEECGIKNLKINKKAGKTYHVYRQKGQRVLKKSVWFFMKTKKQRLTPQVEEKIEKAIWIDLKSFKNSYKMYANICDLLELLEARQIKKGIDKKIVL